MQTGTGSHTYTWIGDWARIPDTETGRANGRTHGVAVTESGNILIYHQANPALLTFSPEGKLLAAWGDYRGAHGLTLVHENGEDRLWLTDQDTSAVVKTTLDGKVLLALPVPDHPAYRTGKFVPTWVAVHEERFGGNGDIWVADGYGSNYVHRFDRGGNYCGAINGTEGRSGPFKCPHAVTMINRHGEAELFVADRGNKRFQVYDPEGRYKREFGAGTLECPCTCVAYDGMLIVPELNARMTLLDDRDQLVCYLGENSSICSVPGWPDFPPRELPEGNFNSPHSAAVDQDGSLYVVEWILGGRITKLIPR